MSSVKGYQEELENCNGQWRRSTRRIRLAKPSSRQVVIFGVAAAWQQHAASVMVKEILLSTGIVLGIRRRYRRIRPRFRRIENVDPHEADPPNRLNFNSALPGSIEAAKASIRASLWHGSCDQGGFRQHRHRVDRVRRLNRATSAETGCAGDAKGSQSVDTAQLLQDLAGQIEADRKVEEHIIEDVSRINRPEARTKNTLWAFGWNEIFMTPCSGPDGDAM